MIDSDTNALDAVVRLESRLVAAQSPYELVTVQRDGIARHVYRHAPGTLNELYRKALQMGTATLAVFGDRRVSYEEVFSEAALFASILRKRFAVSPRVRVAIALEGRPEWLVALVAVTSVGATAVLIDVLNATAIPHSLKVARCALAVIEGSVASEISHSLDEVKHLITTGGNRFNAAFHSTQCSRWDDLLEEARIPLVRHGRGIKAIRELQMTFGARGAAEVSSSANAPASSAQADEAIIAFTSGTTGPPKGVVLSHEGIVTGLMNMALGGMLADAAFASDTAKKMSAKNRMPRRPCSLVLAPLSHVSGYSQLLLALILGGKLVFQKEWDVEAIGCLIDCEQVHSLLGATPAQIRELMRHKPEAGSLTSIGIHGTALHRTLLEEIVAQWPQVTVHSGYGSTETNGSIASISGETLRRYPHCAGRVLPTVEVRIVGLDGIDVELGDIGEVWLRGASLMRGYCTEGSSVEGLADGWFKTGDLGCLSPHRFLSIVDRLNHVIKTGSRRISALELERAVACDTSVAEVAVLCELMAGPRGGRQGEEGISVVVVAVPKFGATLDGEEIRRVVVERGAIAESAVMVVEAPLLPRNRSGKVNRTELRALLARRQPQSLKRPEQDSSP